MSSESQAIKVYCRLRPSKRPSGFFSLSKEEGLVDFNLPPNIDHDLVNNSKLSHKFKFDGLFDMDCKQDEVFDIVAKEAADSALDGYNSTVFAYGQTGSGKTFTITGGGDRYADRGLIPRTLQYVFSALRARTDAQFTVHVSYLEIYNEGGYDLLDSSQESKALEDLPRVQLMEDTDGELHLRGLSIHRVSSEDDALNLLFLGDTNRAIAETPMNMASSRSHCVFTLMIESRTEGSPIVKKSKMHLVDLAGSERVGKTNASGQLFREATYINKSLHYLELVIIALYESMKGKGRHIPYRNSVMTSVLRDSLGGNCKTTMVATINPELEHTNESISTCRFAQRVACVKNSAIRNEETDPVLVIQGLRSRVSALEHEIQLAGGAVAPLDAVQKNIVVQAVKDWISAYISEQLGRASTGEGAETEPKPPDAGGRLPDFGTVPLCAETFTVALGAARVMALEARRRAANAVKRRILGSETGEEADLDEDVDSGDVDLMKALREELRLAKKMVTQRETEITMLVEMVKKMRASCSCNSGAESARAVENNSNPVKTTTSLLPSNSIKTIELPSKTVGTRLGITLPSGQFVSAAVMGDRNQAIAIFRDEVGRKSEDSLTESKSLLRQKYDAAKAAADSVNASRAETNRLKGLLEQARIAASTASGSDAMAPEDSEGEIRNAIEAEKQRYRESFDALKGLKAEIEHMQRSIESQRLKLQQDFEEWYASCLAELNKQAQLEAQSLLASNSSTPTLSNNELASTETVSHKVTLPPQKSVPITASFQNQGSSLPPLPVSRPSSSSAGTLHQTDSFRSINSVGSSVDAEVEDDIAAFYKAKEALQRRTQMLKSAKTNE